MDVFYECLDYAVKGYLTNLIHLIEFGIISEYKFNLSIMLKDDIPTLHNFIPLQVALQNKE